MKSNHCIRAYSLKRFILLQDTLHTGAMPFVLKKSNPNGEKRTIKDSQFDETPMKKEKKVPMVSSLTMMEITPSTKTLKKRPDVAPLNMCIYKVTDNAGDVWSKFKDCTMTKLWQIQFDHNAIPSISYQLGNVLDEFLKEKSSANEEYPKNRDELFRDGGVVLKFSNSNDPDNAGART